MAVAEMATFRRKQVLPKAAEYKSQAEEITAALDVEKVTHASYQNAQADMLAAAAKRVDDDNERIVEQVQILREARERNHFTDRIRVLLTIGNTQ